MEISDQFDKKAKQNYLLEIKKLTKKQLLVVQMNWIPTIQDCTQFFGIFGYKKTFQKNPEKFYWPGLSKDIKEWANM